MSFNENEDVPRKFVSPNTQQSLIERSGCLAPEVSFFLYQDKDKSSHPKSSTVDQYSELKQKNNFEGREQYKRENRFDSYSTWRAKNAEPMYAVTTAGMTHISTMHNTDSRPLSDVRTKNIDGNKHVYTQKTSTISSSVLRQNPGKIYTGEKNNTDNHVSLKGIENCAEMPVYTSNDQHTNYQNVLMDEDRFPQPFDSHLKSRNMERYNYMQNKQQISKESPMILHCPSALDSRNSIYRNVKEIDIEKCCLSNKGSFEINKSSNKMAPDKLLHASYDNKITCSHCQCNNENSNCNIETNSDNCRKYSPKKNKESKMFQMVSPLDIAHINNQTVIELYNMIRIQNEQILMLQQQIKHMLQIHSDCNNFIQPKATNCNCFCNRKHVETADINYNRTIGNGTNESNDDKLIKEKPQSSTTETAEKCKRSIGVMTSPLDNVVDIQVSNNTHKPKIRRKKQEELGCSSLSLYQNKHSKEKKPKKHQEEERYNVQYTSTASKEKKKDKFKTSNDVDNSFSLNEAELRAREERDDISSNNSVHVHMQDYCSSSDSSSGSDSTESSSDQDDYEESGTETEESDPQVGWTFYNQVVGQVNNILKKAPTPPREEEADKSRRTFGNHVYNGNCEYEAENNWSKRVTFDGPLPEDNENNIPTFMRSPRFQQNKQTQEYRGNGVPDRMQDFMMYNIADGNTNLSFATLRCLNRYNVPYQPPQKMPEPMFHGYHKRNKQSKKKKKKSQVSEQYYDTFLQSRKKKNSTPSSKLLDITALKQQPKLF